MAFGEVTSCDIVRKRGDTRPYTLTLNDGDGNAVAIAGFTCTLTVNSVKDPSLVQSPQTGSQIFQASGAPATSPVPSPSDGKLKIDMSAFGDQSPIASNVQPGSYFYDIEVTDADGKKSTVLEGKFTVKQDITK